MENRPLRIRDPIHNIIRYSEQEEDVMNTRLFQHLRGIRQLALAEAVYPGARHSRFEHSIGAMHVAGRLAENVGLSEHMIETVRLAALLHDIGHGPLSHLAEFCLELFTKDEYRAGPHQVHEMIGAQLIREDAELVGLLGKDTTDEIAGIILHGSQRSVATDIVSGPLDCDKLDYLLRDSYYAGVQYGVFDLDRIIEECVPIGNNEGLGFREGAIWAIEQLLLAKHHMLAQVYNHRIRLITDSMVVRGVELAAEDDVTIRTLFSYDESPDFLNRWRNLDDHALFMAIQQSGSPRAKDIFDRLSARRLYKAGFCLNLVRDVPSVLVRNKLSKLTREEKKVVEANLAEAIPLELEPWQVIVNLRSLNAPTIKGSRIETDPDTIFIEDSRGGVDALLNRPEVIKIPKDGLHFLEIYFPMPQSSRRERSEFLNANEDLARSTLFESL